MIRWPREAVPSLRFAPINSLTPAQDPTMAELTMPMSLIRGQFQIVDIVSFVLHTTVPSTTQCDWQSVIAPSSEAHNSWPLSIPPVSVDDTPKGPRDGKAGIEAVQIAF
jgi:hypothetical protein